MGFIETLETWGGKVLDVARMDLLKHTYKLQEDNIGQLKTNNEALKDSNELLKEKNVELKNEVATLRTNLEEARQAIRDDAEPELSEIELKLLKFFGNNDGDVFASDRLRPRGGFKEQKAVLEHALTNLSHLGFLDVVPTFGDETPYAIAHKGREFLIKNGHLK